MYCTNLAPEFIRDCSEASFLLLFTFIKSLSYALNSAPTFSISLYENSLPPLKLCYLVRYVYCNWVGIFSLLWTPPNQLIPTGNFLPRPWDVHLNWSLMFTHHFPVGSDSLRLSSASSSFLLADTSRLTYPQETDVFSCWSHWILITWECAIVRAIYLFSNATC